MIRNFRKRHLLPPTRTKDTSSSQMVLAESEQIQNCKKQETTTISNQKHLTPLLVVSFYLDSTGVAKKDAGKSGLFAAALSVGILRRLPSVGGAPLPRGTDATICVLAGGGGGGLLTGNLLPDGGGSLGMLPDEGGSFGMTRGDTCRQKRVKKNLFRSLSLTLACSAGAGAGACGKAPRGDDTPVRGGGAAGAAFVGGGKAPRGLFETAALLGTGAGLAGGAPTEGRGFLGGAGPDMTKKVAANRLGLFFRCDHEPCLV